MQAEDDVSKPHAMVLLMVERCSFGLWPGMAPMLNVEMFSFMIVLPHPLLYLQTVFFFHFDMKISVV